MAIKKKIKEVEAVEEVKAEVVAEKPELQTQKETLHTKIIVREATGKFYAAKTDDGYVVVNGVGQVVSKAMTQSKAEDMAEKFNK